MAYIRTKFLIPSLIRGKRSAIQYIIHFHSLRLKILVRRKQEFDFEAQDESAGLLLVLRDALTRLSPPEGPT